MNKFKRNILAVLCVSVFTLSIELRSGFCGEIRIAVNKITNSEVKSGAAGSYEEIWTVQRAQVVQPGIITDMGGSTAKLSKMIIRQVVESNAFISDKMFTFGDVSLLIAREKNVADYYNGFGMPINMSIQETLKNKSTGEVLTRTFSDNNALFDFTLAPRTVHSTPWDLIINVQNGKKGWTYDEYPHLNLGGQIAMPIPTPTPSPTAAPRN